MRAIVTRGLGTGAVLAASTAAAMMIAGRLERGSPWVGVNALASAVGAGGRRVRNRFDPVATPVGLAILAGGLLALGFVYERVAATRLRREDRSMRGSITELVRGERIDEAAAAVQRPPADS